MKVTSQKNTQIDFRKRFCEQKKEKIARMKKTHIKTEMENNATEMLDHCSHLEK